jgi:hypothetical protein
MRSFQKLAFFIVLLAFVGIGIPFSAEAGTSAVSGEINLEGQWPIAPSGSEDNNLQVEGAFILREKSGLDFFSPVSATITVSSGQWTANPRVSTYSDVSSSEWTTFIIDVTIPANAIAGENSQYTVTIRFEGQVSSDEVSKGFVVNIISATGDDDTDDDDDEQPVENDNPDEDKSFPIWPVFLLGLIAVVVVGGIWAYRNVEIVRETDGKRRIYLREKDTGRIFGKDR